jgi:hypothetical protein
MERQAQTNRESQPNITKPPHNRCGRGTGVVSGVWRDEEGGRRLGDTERRLYLCFTGSRARKPTETRVMPAMVGRHAPPTIIAWLHISGQERRSKLVKLGNMGKQLFRSSHGALTFTGYVGEPRRRSWVVGRLKELPGYAGQMMQNTGALRC